MEQNSNSMHGLQNSAFCVGIVEAWEEQGYLYICSELCEKGDLNDYICQELGFVPKRKQKQRSSNVTFCTEESVEDFKNGNAPNEDFEAV